MRLTYTISLALLFTLTYGQKNHFISIDNNSFKVYNSSFMVAEVLDNRTENASIGVVKIGRVQHKAQLMDGFVQALRTYYDASIGVGGVQESCTIAFNKLEVSEKYYGLEQTAIVDLIIEYRHETEVLYTDTVHHEMVTNNATKMQGYCIAEALYISMNNYHLVWYNRAIIASQKANNNKSRNITAIGYQIGGLTLIGFNHEIRIADPIGIHFGAGYLGYTIGTKIHFTDTKDGGFINLSFKDGGFGVIQTAALEYGGHYSFGDRTDFGGHFQIGLGKITMIDPAFALKLFKGQPTPNILLSIGAGFSW